MSFDRIGLIFFGHKKKFCRLPQKKTVMSALDLIERAKKCGKFYLEENLSSVAVER